MNASCGGEYAFARILLRMFWPAGNAPDQMTNSIKIESALNFPLNQSDAQARTRLSLGGSTSPERVAVFLAEK
jgi:hypothetical protein